MLGDYHRRARRGAVKVTFLAMCSRCRIFGRRAASSSVTSRSRCGREKAKSCNNQVTIGLFLTRCDKHHSQRSVAMVESSACEKPFDHVRTKFLTEHHEAEKQRRIPPDLVASVDQVV
jgi:hypothetical protein